MGWRGKHNFLDKSKRRNGSNIFNSITTFINLSGEERIKISCLFCSYASVKVPLVKPLSPENNSEVKELAKFFNETLGFCPNSVLTMQIRPDIALAFINLNKAVMENKGRVTSSLKRMIAWVSSNATGCRYCQAHAIRAAERYGADTEKLDNIWDYKTHEAFNDAERAALDFALAASQIPNSVDKGLEDRLKTYWNDGEVVEILGVISLFGFLNRWNDTMGTSLEAEAVNSAEKYLSKNGWNKGKHI